MQITLELPDSLCEDIKSLPDPNGFILRVLSESSDVKKVSWRKFLEKGEVIARVLPPLNEKENARAELMKLRQKCRIGDVISPIGDVWNENL